MVTKSLEEDRRSTSADKQNFAEANVGLAALPKSAINIENDVIEENQSKNSEVHQNETLLFSRHQHPNTRVNNQSHNDVSNNSDLFDAPGILLAIEQSREHEGHADTIIDAAITINVGDAYVLESPNDEIVSAEKLNLLEIMKQKRSIKLFLVYCIITVTAAFIGAIAITFPKSNSTESSPIRKIAIEISGADAFKINDSPQAKALKWMENEDKIQIPVDEKYRFVQRYISAVIYFSTGGPTSWLSNEVIYLNETLNECEWDGWTLLGKFDFTAARQFSKGQHCSDNKTLSALNLYHLNMTGTIPHEIQFLTNLNTLNFGGNLIMTGMIPTELGKLSKLNELFLFDMNLTGTIPSELQNLKSLEVVSIYGNRRISDDFESKICIIPELLFLQSDCGNGTSIPKCSCCDHCCNPDLRICCASDGSCYNTNPDVDSTWT